MRAANAQAPVAYQLAADDQQLRQVMAANIAAGYFSADCDPAVFYDKCAQHRAVSRIDPGLAFSGQSLVSLDALPGDAGRTWVVRPSISPASRGSALLLGLGGLDAPTLAGAMQGVSGPFLLHEHEPGEPLFINGVFAQGQFIVSDAWHCYTLDLEGRRILTAVTSLPTSRLPDGLVPRLAAVASGLGMLHGPLHAEVVVTQHGPRLVKLSPRLASTPLPELCRLGGWPSQEDSWRQLPRMGAGAEQPVADYSFVVTRPGRVKAFRFDQEVRGLASFSHYFVAPPLGEYMAMTTDGTTYGCTVFLRHRSLAVLEEDIARLQALNLADAFEFD